MKKLKVRFTLDGEINQTFEINIDGHKNIKDIKDLILKNLLKENIPRNSNHFDLIYRNIILDEEENLIGFYRLSPDDEIWAGRLEYFLTGDDVIVELVSIGCVFHLVHVVMKKSDPISQIKSIIKRVIGEPSRIDIWNAHDGDRLEDTAIIGEMDWRGGYKKIIISWGEGKEFTFKQCRYMHDDILSSTYRRRNEKRALDRFEWDLAKEKIMQDSDFWDKFKSAFFGYFLDCFLRNFVHDFKKREAYIGENFWQCLLADPRLDELLDFPESIRNSKLFCFLFVVRRISHIFDDHLTRGYRGTDEWSDEFRNIKSRGYFDECSYVFHAILVDSILEYIDNFPSINFRRECENTKLKIIGSMDMREFRRFFLTNRADSILECIDNFPSHYWRRGYLETDESTQLYGETHNWSIELQNISFPSYIDECSLGFRANLDDSVRECIDNIQSNNSKKSLRDILIAASRLESGEIKKRFIDYFLFGPDEDFPIHDKISFLLLGYYISVRGPDFYIPRIRIWRNVKTILQVKEIISSETGIPLDELLLILDGVYEQPKDEDRLKKHTLKYGLQMIGGSHRINISDQIGRGGYGTVHLCKDVVTKQEFALKIFDEDHYSEISFLFYIYKFEPTSIFRCLYRDRDNRICMAMRYLSGGSLKSYLEKRKRLPEEEIARISLKLLEQIKFIHSKDIIHRDIKTDNVMFDEKHEPHLIDFGLAKKCKESQSKMLEWYSKNMEYQAPEIQFDEPYSEKMDIWSFAVMVIEMLTGKKPFPDIKCQFEMAKRARETGKVQYEADFEISEEMQEFIDLSMKPYPNERATAKELLKSQFIKKYQN